MILAHRSDNFTLKLPKFQYKTKSSSRTDKQQRFIDFMKICAWFSFLESRDAIRKENIYSYRNIEKNL